jgi:hypothetical protein
MPQNPKLQALVSVRGFGRPGSRQDFLDKTAGKENYRDALANCPDGAFTAVRGKRTFSRRSTPSVRKIKRSWFCEILTGRPFSQTSRPQ